MSAHHYLQPPAYGLLLTAYRSLINQVRCTSRDLHHQRVALPSYHPFFRCAAPRAISITSTSSAAAPSRPTSSTASSAQRVAEHVTCVPPLFRILLAAWGWLAIGSLGVQFARTILIRSCAVVSRCLDTQAAAAASRKRSARGWRSRTRRPTRRSPPPRAP